MPSAEANHMLLWFTGRCTDGSNGLAATIVPWMLVVTASPAARWRWNSSGFLETSLICTADVRWLLLIASTGTHSADSSAARCWGHASVCVSAPTNSAPRNGRVANAHGSDVAVGDGSALPLPCGGWRGGGCSDAEAHVSDRSLFPAVGKKTSGNAPSYCLVCQTFFPSATLTPSGPSNHS